jgi:hypothetical protein
MKRINLKVGDRVLVTGKPGFEEHILTKGDIGTVMGIPSPNLLVADRALIRVDRTDWWLGVSLDILEPVTGLARYFRGSEGSFKGRD